MFLARPDILNKKYLLLFIVLGLAWFGVQAKPAHAATLFVQSTSTFFGGSASSVALSFNSNVATNDVIAAFIRWAPTSTLMTSATSSCVTGSLTTATSTVAPSLLSSFALIYGVITSSGPCSVRVGFSQTSPGAIVAMHEVSGVNISTPLDTVGSLLGQFTSSTVHSGTSTTSVNGDYIVGADWSQTSNVTSTAGTGFTLREQKISNSFATEDMIQATSGPIFATFMVSSSTSHNYMVGMMALQPSQFPLIGNFSASPALVAPNGTSTLSWNVSNATSVAITPGTFSTSTVIGSTTVNPPSTTMYTLTATSEFGATSTATTSITVDSQPPTIPQNLAVTTTTLASVSLSWSSSTDDISVTGYQIYRCLGSCSPSSTIATTTNPSYTDYGVAPSSTYTYAVAAYDEVNNISAPSTSTTATTSAAFTTFTESFGDATTTSYLCWTGSSSSNCNQRWHVSSGPPSIVASPTPTSTNIGANSLQLNGTSSIYTAGSFPDVSSSTPFLATFDIYVVSSSASYNFTSRVKFNNSVGSSPATIVMKNIGSVVQLDAVASTTSAVQTISTNAWHAVTLSVNGANSYMQIDGGAPQSFVANPYDFNTVTLNSFAQDNFYIGDLSVLSSAGAGSGAGPSLYVDFESGMDGNVVTTSTIIAGTHCGNGTWSLGGGNPAAMTVSTSAQHNLPGPINICGITYTDASSTRGISYNAALSINTGGIYSWLAIPEDTSASGGIWVNLSIATSDGGHYSIAPITGLNDFVSRMVHDGYIYIEVEANPNGSDTYPFGVNLGTPFAYTPNTWYWITTQFNEYANSSTMHYLDVYDASGTLLSAQGKYANSAASAPPTKQYIGLGGDQSSTPNPNFYFDNLEVDYENGQFPLLPPSWNATTSPPSLSWVFPTNNATVVGTVTLTASSTGNGASIASVAFSEGLFGGTFASSTLIGATSTASGTLYSIPWNTTSIANGSTTLWALSTDTSNNTSTATTTVRVQNALPAIASFTASGTIVLSGGTSTLSWSVSNASSVAIDNGALSSTSTLVGSTTVHPISTTLFTLTATNVSGTSTATTTVTVDSTPPSTPTSVAATPTGTSTISLTWTSSTDVGGPGLSGYNIFRCTGSCTPSTSIATSSGASYNDSGLTASTTYTYAVSAYDILGLTSATSSNASATTQSAALPTINSFSFSSTTITLGSSSVLSWNVSNASSVLLTGNNLNLPTSTASGTYAVTPNATGTLTYTLQANNSNGTSTATTTLTVNAALTTSTPPQNLFAFPGNAQVPLSWQAPASDGGSSLTEYLVYDRFTGSSTFALYATTSPAQLNATATSLTNGQSYDFEVIAENSIGTSTPSNVVSSTPYTVPDPPTGVSAVAGNAEATVSFTPPVFNGGSPILYYTSWGNPDNSAASSTMSPITVSGLQNGSSYSFIVTATNAAGTSASSSPSGSVTPTSTAPFITSFTAAPLYTQPGASSTLSWNVTNASSVGITPGSLSTSTLIGSTVVNPTSTTTYTLTASSNGNGTSTAQATVTVDGTAPAIPANLAANAVSAGEIDLSWDTSTDNIGVTGYDVYRDGTNITTVNALTYQDTGLSPNTTYTYTVDAFDAADNVSGQATSTSATTPSSGGGGGGGSSGGGGVSYSMAIDSGAPSTATTSVTLSFYATGAYTMELSNTADFASATWEPYATTHAWILTGVPGINTVYARFRSVNGLDLAMVSASIELGNGTGTGTGTADLEALILSLKEQLQSLIAQVNQRNGGTAVPSAPAAFTRDLELWDRGSDVQTLQTYLVNHDAGPAAARLKTHGTTPVFGFLTYNALREFQTQVGINNTGYFGLITRAYVAGH